MYTVCVHHTLPYARAHKEPTIEVQFLVDGHEQHRRSYHPYEWPLMGMRIRDWVETGSLHQPIEPYPT